MIISFSCPCGNTDPQKAREYDGSLGYEAMLCMACGTVHDDNGTHDVDFDEACGFARQELQAHQNADDLVELQVAMKYAQLLDDDFNNATDAILCEITGALD